MKVTNADQPGSRGFAVPKGYNDAQAGSGRYNFEDTAGNEATGHTAIIDGATVTQLVDGFVAIGIPGGGTVDVTEPPFGAIGDGVADDTAAIQAAIDAACALGDYRVLLFPPGTYLISATLDITCPIKLLGQSAEPNWFDQSVVIQMATANTTAISCTDFEGELSVQNMSIVGEAGYDRDATSGSRGIYTSANINLRGVGIRGFYDAVYIDDSLGALASSSYYSHISECWFHYNSNAGLFLDDQVNNISIRETYFALNSYGIKANGGGFGIRIEDSSFELNLTAGIDIDGTGDTQSTHAVYIGACYFEHFNAAGASATVADIRIGNATQVYGVTIEGCFMVESDIAGLSHIDLNKVDGATLIGNVIRAGTETSSLKCNTSNTTDVMLIGNSFAGTVTTPATTRIVDSTDVTPAAVAAVAAVGTSKYLARADHVHAASASGTTGTSPMLADDAASPFTFDDILQNDEGTAWLFPDA